MKRVIWAIQAVIFYLCTLAFSLLPQGLVRPVGHLIGTMGFVLIPKRRHIAITNIRQSLPAMTKRPDWDFPTVTPEKITRLMFCHLGISLVETCRLYHGRGEEVLQSIEVRGQEYLEAARARGKGVVVLTGHCGNWELAALALARHFNSPMAVVARRQNSPYLNSMVEKMRLRYGNLIIYKDNALRGMMSVIRKNGIVGLLVDQAVFPENGALIDFLGRKAWASKGPVVLARKSGTAVVPAFIHREADRQVIEIQPELVFSDDNSEQGMAANVQKYSRAIENFIVRHPVDWYWVHRRWKRAGELLTD
ncbi:MAG: lysophospholipid acyltransferase family protein [Desulfuromonadaceae bacterium]|nr:lysophospholipid acyltransferase family protein [Desulfuromonadaceae bacterium]